MMADRSVSYRPGRPRRRGAGRVADRTTVGSAVDRTIGRLPARLGPRTACADVAAMSRCAEQREGREQGPCPSPPGLARLGPRTAVCVCRGQNTVGCADQPEGRSRVPPRRVSPGSGRAPPCAVSRPWGCLLCRAARGWGAAPSPAGSHPARAAHRLCVCHCHQAVGVPSSEMEGAGPSSPGLARLGPASCDAALPLSAGPNSMGGSGAPPCRVSPGSGSTAPVHVSQSGALGWAEQREGGGRAPPRRVLPGSGRAHSLCVCRGPDAVGCADQLEGGSRPSAGHWQGLARLGPHTAYACVAAITLSAVPSSEREGQDPFPPGHARLGPRTAEACFVIRMLSAVPSSQRGLKGPLSAGSRPARAAHCLSVCNGLDAVGFAEQREGGGAGSLSAGSRPARAAYHLCVLQPCPCCCLEQRGGGSLPASLNAGSRLPRQPPRATSQF